MDEGFTYFMGVRYDGDIPDGMEELILPGTTYAVFPQVVDAWKRLYSEWLPTSGYEFANQPCIEHFFGTGPQNQAWAIGSCSDKVIHVAEQAGYNRKRLTTSRFPACNKICKAPGCSGAEIQALHSLCCFSCKWIDVELPTSLPILFTCFCFNKNT